MNEHIRKFLLIISLAFIFPCSSLACSIFCLKKDGSLIIGRNYDWGFGEGMIVINKKDQIKTALRYWGESRANLSRWKSKYGSITFVQYGREIAFGGMNEKGLVVNELWLDNTEYPTKDNRPNLSVDQYAQYILDNYQSVDEVVAEIEKVRLRPTTDNFTKIHFFVVDRMGNTLVIEYLNGKAVIHFKETMPVKVLTNNTYEDSINYYQYRNKSNEFRASSLERFANAAHLVSKYKLEDSKDAVTYAFSVLDSVEQGSLTKFKIVFDVNKRIIYFKSLQNPKLRYFSFDPVDFSPRSKSKILDLNVDFSGDVTSLFSDYSTKINERLIIKAWKDLGYNKIYKPALRLVSRYPETFLYD